MHLYLYLCRILRSTTLCHCRICLNRAYHAVTVTGPVDLYHMKSPSEVLSGIQVHNLEWYNNWPLNSSVSSSSSSTQTTTTLLSLYPFNFLNQQDSVWRISAHRTAQHRQNPAIGNVREFHLPARGPWFDFDLRHEKTHCRRMNPLPVPLLKYLLLI